MTGCEQMWELISRAMDGALTPLEERTLEDHLAQCPQCREIYAQMQGMTEGLGELTPPPAGFADRVMAQAAQTEQEMPFTALPQNRDIHRLGREQMRAWWRPIRRAAALVACCLIVVGAWRMANWTTGKGYDSAAPEANNMAPQDPMEGEAIEDQATEDCFSTVGTQALVVDGVAYRCTGTATDLLPEGYTLAGTLPDGGDYYAHPEQPGIYLAGEEGYTYWIEE